MMTSPSTRAERQAQTRRALLCEGRRLFASRGYGPVGLAEIVSAAGVTKGALYHHFESKAELFAAVLGEVAQEVAEQVSGDAVEHDDPWEQLLAGCRAFLGASTAPGVQQIMLLDGPAILGWARWRAIDEQTSARHLTGALETLAATGAIAPQPIEPLARLLSGAMNEAALWLADQADRQAIDEVWAALHQMLESLRA